MIRIVIILITYFIAQLINAQPETSEDFNGKGVSIDVTIPHVSSEEGEVIVALYNSKEGFLKREPLSSKTTTIKEGKATVVFENVLPGEYAVVCLHDRNLNGRMDFNDAGMPMEDYGASNNVYRMGPPLYEDAKFKVENKSLDLKIKF